MRGVPQAGMALGLCAFTIFGCECGEGGGIGKVLPKIAVTPTSLAFNDVPLGAIRHLTLRVDNSGSGDLHIQGVDASQPFSATLSANLVRAGASTELDVVYAPTAEADDSGQLAISSDADQMPLLSVPLAGRGVAGYLSVEPKQIDLQNTPVGAVRGAEIVALNRGVEAVAGRVVPVGFPRTEHFLMRGLADFQVGPYAIAARGEGRFALEYRPLAMGEDTGRILFETCGEGCGVEVAVRASAVAAAVRIEPASLDLGDVGLGSARTLFVTVHNDGSSPLELLATQILGSLDAHAVPARELPMSLAPGSSLAIGVEYQPTIAAELVAELVIETADPGLPRASVPVRGRGVGPRFDVEPESIDFGTQTQVAKHRRAFLMLNAGSSAVRILGVELSGDSVFALEAVPGLPARLASGESIAPWVTFTPPGGLAAYTGALAISTDDPAQPTVTVPISAAFADRACRMEVSPSRVNFGLLLLGTTRRKSVTVTNAGTDPCHLVSGAFRAPVDAAIRQVAGSFPQDLLPGQSTSLAFDYTPTANVESKGVFVVTTDDPVLPLRAISLVGSARTYDDLFVLPSAVNFGSIPPGCSIRDRAVTVYNAGVQPASIDAVTLAPSSPELSFTTPPAAPVVVQPGGNAPFTLTFAPVDDGPEGGELEIHFADRPFAFVVPITGSGGSNPLITDAFVQVENRVVDVLFVVDDSCSMEEEQGQLATNFGSFISTANLRQVDFRIGVTTTTVEFVSGLFRGPVLNANSSNLEREFQRQVAVGTLGSGMEQGLEAMLGAIQRGAAGHRPNSDMFRSTAAWVLIIVSDEDDSSPGSVPFYFNELSSRAHNSFMVAIVSGGRQGCVFGNQAMAFAAPRYANFLQLTGGIDLSICQPNWSQTLSALGNAAFGLRHRFTLSQPVRPSTTVEVRVDGVLQPTSIWSYDPASRSIDFAPGSAPPARSTIEVTYRPDC